MAKKIVKTVYDNLDDNQNEIKMAEENLLKLKEKRVGLLQQKDIYEMKKMWDILQTKKIDIDKFEEIVSKIKLA